MDRQECLSDRKTLDFADDFGGRKAAAFPADEGDDAVGAAGVAAVLDFESGAGVIPFSAEDGSREKFGAVVDVAGKDLAKLGPSGRGKPRPREGMERNGWGRMAGINGEKVILRF